MHQGWGLCINTILSEVLRGLRYMNFLGMQCKPAAEDVIFLSAGSMCWSGTQSHSACIR